MIISYVYPETTDGNHGVLLWNVGWIIWLWVKSYNVYLVVIIWGLNMYILAILIIGLCD